MIKTIRTITEKNTKKHNKRNNKTKNIQKTTIEFGLVQLMESNGIFSRFSIETK